VEPFIIVQLLWACIVPVDLRAQEESKPQRMYEGFDLFLRIYFKPLPDEMPGGHNDTPEMVELGRRLFFERGISVTGTKACNDCHRLNGGYAGIDGKPTSTSATGISGRRNTPTVLNAGFQVVLFWDGRAVDLVEQAKVPIIDPFENAMPSEAAVMSRLKGIGSYRRDFERAFPGGPEPMTFEHVAQALAAFERTLITPARFDCYLKGDKSVLTRPEEAGLRQFVDTGCAECHNSYPVGGRLLRKLGIYHAYKNREDTGRFGVSGREEDRFVFKVCMLRNVTLTAPYFHDGGISTLPAAVRLMAWLQLDKILRPDEVAEIVDFLRTLEGHPRNGLS
jgi:cytochrome c peroxidase